MLPFLFFFIIIVIRKVCQLFSGGEGGRGRDPPNLMRIQTIWLAHQASRPTLLLLLSRFFNLLSIYLILYCILMICFLFFLIKEQREALLGIPLTSLEPRLQVSYNFLYLDWLKVIIARMRVYTLKIGKINHK